VTATEEGPAYGRSQGRQRGCLHPASKSREALRVPCRRLHCACLLARTEKRSTEASRRAGQSEGTRAHFRTGGRTPTVPSQSRPAVPACRGRRALGRPFPTERAASHAAPSSLPLPRQRNLPSEHVLLHLVICVLHLARLKLHTICFDTKQSCDRVPLAECGASDRRSFVPPLHGWRILGTNHAIVPDNVGMTRVEARHIYRGKRQTVADKTVGWRMLQGSRTEDTPGAACRKWGIVPRLYTGQTAVKAEGREQP
jgi:hypothetical protein